MNNSHVLFTQIQQNQQPDSYMHQRFNQYNNAGTGSNAWGVWNNERTHAARAVREGYTQRVVFQLGIEECAGL